MSQKLEYHLHFEGQALNGKTWVSGDLIHTESGLCIRTEGGLEIPVNPESVSLLHEDIGSLMKSIEDTAKNRMIDSILTLGRGQGQFLGFLSGDSNEVLNILLQWATHDKGAEKVIIDAATNIVARKKCEKTECPQHPVSTLQRTYLLSLGNKKVKS